MAHRSSQQFAKDATINHTLSAPTERLETMARVQSTEDQRLDEDRTRKKYWKRWGPYLSERQWGTVREDYSPGGTAWEYLPHDHARSRAYRWGEDGIGGISDRRQMICFGLALWNGRDPILKERLFGLTGNQGNHGEDVKEYYFYQDSTPTHSYMRMLYKYPQAEFPYTWLVEENGRRNRQQPEFELLDTGVFAEDRYFDVFIEYAKADVEDILIKITAVNRGPEAATLHLLPSLWFRNTWSWGRDLRRPSVQRATSVPNSVNAEIEHWKYGKRWLLCAGAARTALHRKRNQFRQAIQRQEPLALCEGCFPRILDSWKQIWCQSAADGHENGCVLSAAAPPRAKRNNQAAAYRHGAARYDGTRSGTRRHDHVARTRRPHCWRSGS